MTQLREYDIQAPDGRTYTAQLDSADAKAYEERGYSVKAKAAANKARTATTKD